MILFRSRARRYVESLRISVDELQIKLAARDRQIGVLNEQLKNATKPVGNQALIGRIETLVKQLDTAQTRSGYLEGRLQELKAELDQVRVVNALAPFPADAQRVIGLQQRNLVALSNQLADALDAKNPPVRLGGWL